VNISAFQVLADPNRMQIVQLLLDGERAVNDLVDRMAIQQSGVSRHLRILEEAGFVQTRAVGTKRIYSLRPERFQELDRWLTQYRQLWSARLDAFGSALEAKQKRRAEKRRKGNK
jgi:DNA-binding transcriptional ArsR family regulator